MSAVEFNFATSRKQTWFAATVEIAVALLAVIQTLATERQPGLSR
jgi:hypothetical protein